MPIANEPDDAGGALRRANHESNQSPPALRAEEGFHPGTICQQRSSSGLNVGRTDRVLSNMIENKIALRRCQPSHHEKLADRGYPDVLCDGMIVSLIRNYLTTEDVGGVREPNRRVLFREVEMTSSRSVDKSILSDGFHGQGPAYRASRVLPQDVTVLVESVDCDGLRPEMPRVGRPIGGVQSGLLGKPRIAAFRFFENSSTGRVAPQARIHPRERHMTVQVPIGNG